MTHETTPSLPDIDQYFTDPLKRGLACAALHPALRTVLVYDLEPQPFFVAADLFAQLLRVITRKSVELAILSAVTTEEDIWGSYHLQNEAGASNLAWQPGILTPLPEDRRSISRLVLVPDLARLSLAAMRACIMLTDAATANLERHGRHEQWTPDLCWLAACAEHDLGQVSPHLLDRFGLRLEGQFDLQTRDANGLREWVEEAAAQQAGSRKVIGGAESPVAPAAALHLQRAARVIPSFSMEAVRRVLDLLPAAYNASLRRPIALARLAVAESQLQLLNEVTETQVDAAARILRMPLSVGQDDNILPEPGSAPDTDKQSEIAPFDSLIAIAAFDLNAGASSESLQNTVIDGEDPPGGQPVHDSTDITYAPPTEMPPLRSPYREDIAPVERETEPLRLPTRGSPQRASCGTIVGTTRATHVHDLALVRTLIEAAKFQPIRRMSFKTAATALPSSMLIRPTDLHTYRREPAPEQLLVVVLDYTALRDCEWPAALAPHLRWAYVQRANLCIVQVGAKTAPDRLRATRVTARSLLTPRIGAALTEPAGTATPLAHGIEIARFTLQKAMQRGRNAVRSARLVVLTDGRGNVPLEFSHTGRTSRPVSHEGIDDALMAARLLVSMKGSNRIQKILLDPQPRQYPGLPADLAQALQAVRESIPLSAIATEQ